MKKGDIIKVDYDLYNADTEELLETTKEELAQENDMFDEKTVYKPRTMIVGANNISEVFDSSLLKADVGKDVEVDIPPEKGFGDRNPDLVELHSRREIMRLPEFRKGDMEPFVGLQIMLKNRPGTISAVTAGRIRVDFNHPYAGKTLKYRYKITEAATKAQDKVKAILDMHYANTDDFKLNIKGNTVEMVLPEMCKIDQSWFMAKYRVVGDLREWADMDVIRMVEEYVKPKPDKEPPAEDDKGDEDKGNVSVDIPATESNGEDKE